MLKNQNEEFHQYLLEKKLNMNIKQDLVFWNMLVLKHWRGLPLDKDVSSVNSIESEGKYDIYNYF